MGSGSHGRRRKRESTPWQVLRRIVFFGVIGLSLMSAAIAATLQGIELPERQTVGHAELLLNGIGLRTYSIFAIPIYVAGLYLVHRDSDADRILQSTEPKLLEIRFVHDVSERAARSSWREGLANNCLPPCQLSPTELEQFLGAVRAMHKGDRFSLLFTGRGAEIGENGQHLGSVTDPEFAAVLLATFIGPHPAMPRLKQDLLGNRPRPNPG
jgi:hypothetical protein